MSTIIEKISTSVHDDPYTDPETVGEAVGRLHQVDRTPFPRDDAAFGRRCDRMRRATAALALALDEDTWGGQDYLDHADAPPPPAWAETVTEEDDAGKARERFYARELVLLRRRLALAIYWADLAIDLWRKRHEEGAWDSALGVADSAAMAALRAGLNGHELYNRPR